MVRLLVTSTSAVSSGGLKWPGSATAYAVPGLLDADGSPRRGEAEAEPSTGAAAVGLLRGALQRLVAGGAAGQRPGQRQRQAQHDGTRARTPAASQLHWCPSPRIPRLPTGDVTPSVPCLVTRGEGGSSHRSSGGRATHPRGRRGRTAGMPATETTTATPPRAPSPRSGRPWGRWVAGGLAGLLAGGSRGRGLGGARGAAERGHLPAAGGRQPGRRRDTATSQGVRDRDVRRQGQAGAHHRGVVTVALLAVLSASVGVRRPRLAFGGFLLLSVVATAAALTDRAATAGVVLRLLPALALLVVSTTALLLLLRTLRTPARSPARGRANALHPRVATGPQPPPRPRPSSSRPRPGSGRSRPSRTARPGC